MKSRQFLIKLADIFLVLPSTVPMFPRGVTWVGIFAKLSKKLKQYVYGVDCEMPSTYDVSTNGRCVKVELGNGKFSHSLKVMIINGLKQGRGLDDHKLVQAPQ